MPQPIATPLRGADRIAGLVLLLEETDHPSLTTTALAVREIGGAVAAYVICHLADGSREWFTASDTRLVALAVRDSAGIVRQADVWADSLAEAADAAERQASAILLGLAATRGVSPMRAR